MKNRQIMDNRYAESVVHISPAFMKKASENNKIELIVRETSEAILGSKYNIYFRVKGTRYVLMHVKNNWYTVINERIWCQKTNRWVHLVSRLANGFHFNLYNGEITTTPRKRHKIKRKRLYLYRIIMSYALYNKADALESTKEVHHIYDRFYNLISCLRYVNEDYHKQYHSQHGNDSKRAGRIIYSYKELCDFLKEIKVIDKMASVMPM